MTHPDVSHENRVAVAYGRADIFQPLGVGRRKSPEGLQASRASGACQIIEIYRLLQSAKHLRIYEDCFPGRRHKNGTRMKEQFQQCSPRFRHSRSALLSAMRRAANMYQTGGSQGFREKLKKVVARVSLSSLSFNRFLSDGLRVLT